MITKQEASDLIYAGVLGCLDHADQLRFNEYIRSGGELLSNMGELQNIAALLPIILQAENPDSRLKDKVARKLYRIKDEVRAKVGRESTTEADKFYDNSREDRKAAGVAEQNLPAPSENKNFTIKADSQNEKKDEEKIPDSEVKNEDLNVEESDDIVLEEIVSDNFEPVSPSRNTFESFKSTREKVLEGNFDDVPEEEPEVKEEEAKPESKSPTREKIRTYERVVINDKPAKKTPTKETPSKKISTKERGKSFEKAYKKRYMTDETSNKKAGINIWLVITLFTILFLALVVLYLNFSTEIKDLKYTNAALRQQVNDLSAKFNSTQDIQNIMESSEVKVINLRGTGINPDGKGKLIISGSQNKGYLQLSNMPVLGSNNSYQLWMQLPNGKYYSLGVFYPTGRVQYFPFNIPHSEYSHITEFLVTEESSTGAPDPGNKVFLTGNL